MKPSELNLENLTMFDLEGPEADARFAAVQAEIAAEKQAYQAKYGDEWRKYYYAPKPEDDILERKCVNETIYKYGLSYPFMGDVYWRRTHGLRIARLRELFGDQYNEVVSTHTKNDSRVGEQLIQEALRTGEWRVLPDDLLDEYQKRGGDVS